MAAPPRERITHVRIPVWLDASPGRELTAKDFTATIDGASARVVQVRCPDDDLVILLVLDLSSSDLTLADPAKETLTADMRKLPPNAFVGLLRAQDGLLAPVDTAGHMADAMLEKSAVRVAIRYITDGDVRNYREDFTNPVINSSDSH